MALSNPANERRSVLSFVSAGQDILFWEKVDFKNQRVRDTAIGAAHWDAATFPNHKLVFRAPLDQAGENYKFYYAADRENQDDYNWTFNQGQELIRFYVIKRSLYYARTAAQIAATPIVAGEFPVPVVATADSRFSNYGFADDTVVELPDEIRSTYIGIQRRYLIPVIREVNYDDMLDLDVVTTRTLIAKTTEVAASEPGTTREREHGNAFHDWEVKTQVGTVTYPGGVFTLTPPTYPIELESIPTHLNYSFPPLLRGVSIVASWAYADSEKAARSYDEAYYFDFDLVKPTNGPFEARKLRFVTNDPDSLRSAYPVDKIITVQETIGITRAWFYASDKGNSTFAEARQLEVPESIHDDLEIANSETLSVGQNKNRLEATPGFRRFEALSSMIIGYEPSKARYGLYIVEVIELNVTGIYDGNTVPFGTDGGSTGATTPRPPAQGSPVLPTAIMALDNASVSGVTTPYAEVSAKAGNVFYGRSVASESGSYTIDLDPVEVDVVTVNVTSRIGGLSSGITPVLTYDLAPDAPDATISSDLTRVSGVTEPNATISILKNGVAQVETLVIPTDYQQSERLTVSTPCTGSGDALCTITWVGFNGGVPYPVTVAVLNGDSVSLLAEKTALALIADATVDAFFNVSNNGAAVTLQAKVVAADDPTALFTLDNNTSTGLTLDSSVALQAGGTMAVGTSGTAVLTVTSAVSDGSPLSVSFFVTSGDNASDVALKAANALSFSLANDDYIASSSTNTTILTARVVASNDSSLNIALSNGTCTGLIEVTNSTGTTSGGTIYSTTANGAGSYAYDFSPVLNSGDILSVTASDSGGTSAPTTVKASATPPVLTSASFAVDVYDEITGVATAASKVIAYIDDTEIGDAIADGSGNYQIALATPLNHGEEVRVIAVIAGDESVRSSIITIEANSLQLDPPDLTYYADSNKYTGTVPLINGMKAWYSILSVSVNTGDPAATIAQNAVDDLILETSVDDFYVVTRSGTDIILTAKSGIVFNRNFKITLSNIVVGGSTVSITSSSTSSAVSPQVITCSVPIGATAGIGDSFLFISTTATDVVYQLASGGPEFLVRHFAGLGSNGNYSFELPTKDGARYKIFYRFPDFDSDPVYVYATFSYLPQVRFWPMAYRAIDLDPYTAIVTRRYSTIAAYREAYSKLYNNYQNQVAQPGRSGVFFLYIPFWYAGMIVRISYPGQETEALVDTPANPGVGYDVRYTLGTTTLPEFVDVTITLLDGRSISAFFDRASPFSFMIYDGTA